MLQSISLLDRIEHFELDDPGASLPFSARLARENEWSRDFTERVITEYKRFIYLSTIASHPVTPSEAVDEAWHFHLTYTRSYWEQLCGEVLGKPLHHEPTRGGTAESTKYHDLYSKTLALYEQTFGSAPPPDIWPPVAKRFAPPAKTSNVSPATHWIIRKPSRRTVRVVVALVMLLIAGWVAQNPPHWITSDNPAGLIASWVLHILSVIVSWGFSIIAFIWNVIYAIVRSIAQSIASLVLTGLQIAVGFIILGCIGLPFALLKALADWLFGQPSVSQAQAHGGDTSTGGGITIEGGDDSGGGDSDYGCSGCGGCSD